MRSGFDGRISQWGPNYTSLQNLRQNLSEREGSSWYIALTFILTNEQNVSKMQSPNNCTGGTETQTPCWTGTYPITGPQKTQPSPSPELLFLC